MAGNQSESEKFECNCKKFSFADNEDTLDYQYSILFKINGSQVVRKMVN
jgi:hypothetical protein